MQELYEEEQKQAMEQEHRASVEKALRQRIEVRESLMHQMIERQERLKAEAAEDAKYKEELLAKMAEYKRLELLSNEKRRLKMIECRKEVEKMMIERRQRHAEEMQLLLKLKEQEEMEAEER